MIFIMIGIANAHAWTVPERVVELEQNSMIEHFQGNAVNQTPLFRGLSPTLDSLELSQKHTPTVPSFSFQKTPSKLSLAEENKSRVELATLYLQQNHLDVAQTLLSETLLMDEYHPESLRLMALIADRKQEPEKALEFLSKVKTHQRQEREYVSFLAYLYQKTGQYDLAKQHYFRLLENDPQNPAWVLGLSMALESCGQRESALEGYKRLSHQPDIDPNIVKYAKERILVLKG